VTAVAAGADKLARLNVAETQLSAEQAQNMSRLAKLLSVIEQLRRDPPPALLVSPEDARDAVRAAILVKALTPELQSRAQVYAREAGEMVRRRRLAAVEDAALFANDSARADAAPPPASPNPLLRGQAEVKAGPVLPPQVLLAPASGEITRRFGEPAPGGGRAAGVSWATVRGARVASPGAGLVQYVGPVKGWGLILILRLAGGYHLVLAGLAQASVSVGQSVAPGQPVGWMPDGRQSSPELYLELRDQGAPVDPARWLVK
jgi:septal ring factor EnvC (AmiA/AmiB activator)